MYNLNEYKKLMERLEKEDKLFKPESKTKDNVVRSKHFYQDNVTAMLRHMNNMIETYGKEQVIAIIRNMIETGDFCE